MTSKQKSIAKKIVLSVAGLLLFVFLIGPVMIGLGMHFYEMAQYQLQSDRQPASDK